MLLGSAPFALAEALSTTSIDPHAVDLVSVISRALVTLRGPTEADALLLLGQIWPAVQIDDESSPRWMYGLLSAAQLLLEPSGAGHWAQSSAECDVLLPQGAKVADLEANLTQLISKFCLKSVSTTVLPNTSNAARMPYSEPAKALLVQRRSLVVPVVNQLVSSTSSFVSSSESTQESAAKVVACAKVLLELLQVDALHVTFLENLDSMNQIIAGIVEVGKGLNLDTGTQHTVHQLCSTWENLGGQSSV